MRHLVVIAVVICAVISDVWAQNRGSSRYAAPDDYDSDITRAPRLVPTRGAAVRRQRPTKTPEPIVEDELKDYQPPESPVRTTARRVPQRTPQQLAPPPPPPVPVEEVAPLHPAPVIDPQVPPTGPEGRPQGTRRRRPKKRRRPQAAVPKVAEEPEKQPVIVPEKDKISELLNDDEKRTETFQSNTQSRNAPPNFDSDPSYPPAKASWENDPPVDQPQSNVAGPQYFRPQPAANRLPIDETGPVGNSREYVDSSPDVPNVDAPAPYVPQKPPTPTRNEASYVPVLPPIRVPSEGTSRLPPEDYPSTRTKESTRQSYPSDYSVPLRSHGNRSPVADPDDVIRNTGAKPIHNIIPQIDDPNIPARGHSEVRLPEVEKPLLSPEYPSSDFAEDLPIPPEPSSKSTGDNEEPHNPANRLPNPSEIHYDSVYPEFLDNHSQGPQRIAGRRQEHVESPVRNPSYSSSRRDTGTKPQEYDNDAEIDRRQASQYRPPLQRSGSKYSSEDSEGPTRSRAQQTPSTSLPRGRGSSRYQAHADEIAPERTRSPARHSVESDSPSRSRSSSATQSNSRTRGSQRYAPETVENTPSTSSRRQPIPQETERRPPNSGYIPIDEIIENGPRSPSSSSRTVSQPSPSLRTESEPEFAPARNTLRSRPQYEIRDAEPVHAYEEPIEDANDYSPPVPVPRQSNTRGRANQRTPVSRQQPPEPEYQAPPTRPQSRQAAQYEPPQNPRTRHQPQYQAPQNPREENTRQNAPSSRQQGRSRYQETPETPAPRSRPSAGSKFVCPESFGFFADPVQCDKYYECRNGTAEENLCSDGLAFNEISAPKFLRCDSLRDVDCKSRPELQEPQPTKNCPRRFGLFPHETDCTKFWNCVDGTSTEVQCPPGLTYNDDRATCDWADLVETSCKIEDLLGFKCPEPTITDLQDGVYSRYPHPDNCQLHYTCIKGADGLRRPRMLSCNEGLVFDPATSSCKRPEEVPGCEEFYGPRSPPPKRKPARQPATSQPEEYLEEEPTPRPRRRGSNRRVRN